jgi:hypothetical protein
MDLNRVIRVCLISLAFVVIASAQQVEVARDGQHVLHLSPAQQGAVNSFLSLHPAMKLVGCDASGSGAKWCESAYSQWEAAVKGQNATPQFPTAAWGDFRGKGMIDFAMAFYTPKPPNTPGWAHGEVVVFENLGGDKYRPVVGVTDDFGGCLDGMVFHPVRKQLEMWCNTATATVKWNGTTFVGHTKAGD